MKKLILFILIVLCIIIGINIISTKQKDTKNNTTNKKTEVKDERLKKLDYINEKVSYFKEENIDRYIKYHEENKNLDMKDVVIRVNLNLDKPYYSVTEKTPYQNKDYILVNKYIYMDSDYTPDNLEDLDLSYSRSGMKLVKSAKVNLEKMVESAKNDGYTIRVMSSFRSYNYQVNLYNKYVENDGKEAADTYSARPGFSEHQTGLCVDIDDGKISYTNFENSPSFKWMEENAAEYGFILRYPKNKTDITGYTYESWHYRYVGKKIASYIKKHNITFDEYYAMYLDDQTSS